MAKVKLDKTKLIAPAFGESFEALESVFNEDRVKLAAIDKELGQVQTRLKALKLFDIVLGASEVDMPDGILVYDFNDKTLIYHDANQAAVPLLSAPAKIRKEAHAKFIVKLLEQISADYKEAKEKF